jgi:hypothetical protein
MWPCCCAVVFNEMLDCVFKNRKLYFRWHFSDAKVIISRLYCFMVAIELNAFRIFVKFFGYKNLRIVSWLRRLKSGRLVSSQQNMSALRFSLLAGNLRKVVELLSERSRGRRVFEFSCVSSSNGDPFLSSSAGAAA